MKCLPLEQLGSVPRVACLMSVHDSDPVPLVFRMLIFTISLKPFEKLLGEQDSSVFIPIIQMRM